MRGDVEKLDLLNKYNAPTLRAQTDLTSLLRPLFWLKRNPGAASDDGRGGAVDVILADGIHVRVPEDHPGMHLGPRASFLHPPVG